MGLNLTCGCNWHNPGEEQHIEIYVGIPEDDDPSDPKYDNIETFLEQFVNKIGEAENEGEKWGDASFQWISDEELFGELWPIDEQGREIGRGKYAESKRFGKKFVKESSDGGKARIERLCANLEKQYDTLTYDEIEGKLKKAGFVLDEYGGKTNAYAVFVHDCGIVVNLEYQFVKDYGTRDSWHAANVTYFGWYDDPEYQRWSNESTKKLINERLDYVDSTNDTVTLCNDCPFCKKHYEFTIKMDYDDFIDAMWKYKYGARIQDAFPNLTADEREQIKTGICNDCWDSI